VFKIFKAYVEKEAEAYIMCLRTDRGGEFLSKDFEEFFHTHGIQRQLTTTYTRQQKWCGIIDYPIIYIFQENEVLTIFFLKKLTKFL